MDEDNPPPDPAKLRDDIARMIAELRTFEPLTYRRTLAIRALTESSEHLDHDTRALIFAEHGGTQP